MKKIRSAFTLIELAVVLIVIGIIIAGIAKGTNLIGAARLNGARSITSKSMVPNIPGLLAWYETTSTSSFKSGEGYEGAQTTEWRDISPSSIIGQKNTLAKSASATVTYKAVGINGTPSLKFNGSGTITIANLYQGNSGQLTVFLVFEPTATISGTVTLFDSNTAGSTAAVGVSSSTVSLNAGSSVTVSTTISSGKDYIVAAYLNNTVSGAYINNATTIAGTVTAGSNELTGITVGSNKSGSSGFTGLISEVIVYNRPLNLQERIDVMRYLSRKYKITVTGV